MEETVEVPEPTQEALGKLVQSNADRLRALRSYNVMPDPRTVLAIRLEAFIDTFITPEDKIAFEMNFEASMANALRDMLSQVTQAQLTQGVPEQANKLFVAGK